MTEQEEQQQTDAVEAGPRHEFMSRLATYLKDRTLYPANNQRVQRGRDSACATLAECGGVPIPLIVRASGLSVAGLEYDADADPLASWLRERLVRAALGGVIVEAITPPASIERLADLMLEALAVEKPVFEECWGEEVEGLTFRPLRFSGSHVEGAFDEDDAEGDGGHDSGVARLTQVWASSESEVDLSDPFVAAMLRNQGLVDRLAELDRQLVDEVGGGDRNDLVAIDLLDAVRQAMPVEVASDPEKTAQLIEEVLRSFGDRLLAQLGKGGSTKMSELEFLMTEVGRKIFVSKDNPEQIKPESSAGWPEDEAIVDDFDAMLADLAELPSKSTREILASGAPGKVETIGVYLHMLVASEDDRVVERARAAVKKSLEKSPELEQQLVPYMEASSNELPEHAGLHLWRVVALAHDLNLRNLIASGSTLTVSIVGKSFPSLFLAFLDHLGPWGGSGTQQQVDTVLTAIGPRRMLRAARSILDSGELHVGMRLETVLSTGHETMLPIVEHLAEDPDPRIRGLVVAYLLRRYPAQPESLALRVVQSGWFLSKDYLADLAAMRWTDEHRAQLRSKAGRLLRSFIRGSAGDAGMAEYRLRAVQQLPLLPSQANLELLDQVRHEAGLSLNLQARAIRRAAQSSWVQMKAQLQSSGS